MSDYNTKLRNTGLFHQPPLTI